MVRFMNSAGSEGDSDPEDHSVDSNFKIFARPLVHGDTILGRVWLEAQDNTMALKCTRVRESWDKLMATDVLMQTYHVNIQAVARVNAAPAWKVNVFQWRDTVSGHAEGSIYSTGDSGNNTG